MRPRITVWGINYAPEVTGIAPYNTALCQFLRQSGCDVRMVTTFPYYPAWKKQAADCGRFFRTDLVDGIPVHRCWHFVPAKVRTLKRIAHEASFVASSFLRQLALPRPGLLIVISPPLLLGAAAWLLGVLKRSPFVFHVQDLQPDAAAGLGLVRPGLFMRLLYRLERFAYARAARVSGISLGMLEAFSRKGVPQARQIYFPNGVHLPAAQDLPLRGRFRGRHQFGSSDFLAIYSGNLGVKQGLEVLVEASPFIRHPHLRIIICGDGSQRPQLTRLIERLEAKNVLLLPLQSEESYPEMLCDADLCLITQQRGSGQFFLPSKLLTTLALGKPVLSVADESSDLVKSLRIGGFGLNVLPERPRELAAALDDLAGRPDELTAFGQAGRRYVEQFAFEKVHRRLCQDLQLAGLIPPLS